MSEEILVVEKPESRPTRDGAAGTTDLVYDVWYTDSSSDALAALKAEAPTTFNGRNRSQSAVEPVKIIEGEPGKCLWRGTVSYVAPGRRPQTGDDVFSFSTGGGTAHITQSISTTSATAPAGKTAPDFKGAIGFDGKTVQGVDIGVSEFAFTVTRYIDDDDVDATYVGQLYALTNKVNDDTFTAWGLGSFNAGECRFLGASGTRRADGEDWEIQFSFSAIPNKANLDVGGTITVPAKKGHEYLWVRYEEAVDADRIAVQPVAAYVEKVYDDGDFDDLDPAA